MRLPALLFLAFLALPSSAFALKGRVVDQQGRPVANATISILGKPGEAITDADGRFEWLPDPTPPFEVLVIDKAGTYSSPVLIERIDAGQELTVTIAPLLNESVTVSGSAPSIEATAGAATTSISGRDVSVRQPTNLMQAIENVAGVNQVSEGQAAVPAIRGLARGRTLILIDGARVSSERRVGASATFLDPSLVEGVDVARGPGSVAYGSDAFGGVISVRTKRVSPGSPWAATFSGTLGTGVPDRRGSLEVSKGLPSGGFILAAHARESDDWRSPEGEVFNSGYSDRGFMVRAEHQAGTGVLSAGWQSDFGRDIERPRNNSRTVRFYYPSEDSHRFTAGYEARAVAGFQRVGITTFVGSNAQSTDQDRFATASAGRIVERADVSARDFQVRGFGERLFGKSRLEIGLDVNGRTGLHAVEDVINYNLAGDIVSTRPFVSVDSARRVDTGAYVSIDSAVAARLVLGGGVRADYVATKNEGGYFGDRSSGNGSYSGFASATLGSFRGFSLTGQLARGFRDPVLSDRYYRGPTGRGFITGNPDLGPETSIQGDFALRYVAPRFRFATYYYEYRINDLIERYAAETDFFYFRNRGTARIRGFEIEGQADLGAGVSLELATQAADGRAIEDDAYLDDMSPFNLSMVVRKQFSERAFGQVRVAYFSDDDNFGPTERAVPGYTVLDAAAGLKVAGPLELRIQARNLLDQEYFASQDVRTVLAPGRSASVIATVKF
ncbi:MAG: TonB-dependent receptor [Vicinamibacterales bacterium]